MEKQSSKKFVYIFFFLTMVTLLVFVSFSTNAEYINAYADVGTYGGGNGTTNNPYLITSAEHLLEMDEHLSTMSDGLRSRHFKLENNIDLSEVRSTISTIGGSDDRAFEGVFDGNGKMLFDLDLSFEPLATNFNALFYEIGEEGTVKNLGMCNISLSTNSANIPLAGIALTNKGLIETSFFAGNLIGSGYVGGIVAVNDGGRINRVYSSGNIQVGSTGGYVGGLIGEYKGASIPQQKGVVKYGYSLMKIDTSRVSSAVNMGCLIGIIADNETSQIDRPSLSFARISQTDARAKDGHNEGLPSVYNWAYNNDYPHAKFIEYQDNTLGNLFSSDEGNWRRLHTSKFSGEGIYAPVLQKFFRTGTGAHIDEHNYMVKQSATIRFFGYFKNYEEWGTPLNPLLIENINHFIRFSNAVNMGFTFANKEFKLVVNLTFGQTLSDVINGVGIYNPTNSNDSRPFKGVFDGDAHTINNFILRKSQGITSAALGLFNYVDGATIKNLYIGNTGIVDGQGSIANIGVLAGYSINSHFENISVLGTVQGSNANATLGGIVARADGGSFQTLLFKGKIIKTSHERIGGIIGFDNNVSSCLNCWFFIDHTQKELAIGYDSKIGFVFLDNNTPVEYSQSWTSVNLENKSYKPFYIEWNTIPKDNFSVEYRNLSEVVLSYGVQYETDKLDSSFFSDASDANRFIFARYVKNIYMKKVLENDDPTDLGEQSYYIGEKISYYTPLEQDFYLTEVIVYSELQMELEYDLSFGNLRELNFYTQIGFYNAVFGENLPENTHTITFVFKEIKPYIDFFKIANSNVLVYKGAPYMFEDFEEHVGSFGLNEADNGFAMAHYGKNQNVGVRYFESNRDPNLEAPKNVNRENEFYYLDLIYCAPSLTNDKLYLGKTQVEYGIKKKEIEVPVTAISINKEYNGIVNDYEETTVDLTDVEDVYVVDRNILLIKALIKYKGQIDSVEADISLSLVNRDFSLLNYSLIVSEIPEVTAHISKRNIYVPIKNLELKKEYDGKKIASLSFFVLDNAIVNNNPLVIAKDVKFTFERKTPINISDDTLPGKFKVEVSFQEAEKNTYFKIGFVEKLGEKTYLEDVSYSIQSRRVLISYFGISNLIYDGTIKEGVLAIYQAESNDYQMPSSNGVAGLTVKTLDDVIVAELINAGDYKIVIDLDEIPNDFTVNEEDEFHKYILIIPSEDVVVEERYLEHYFNIKKANQSLINITSSPMITFDGSKYKITLAGGDAMENLEYSILEKSTGEGNIVEIDYLEIFKAGDIYIQVKSSGDDNYEAKTSEEFCLTVRKGVAHIRLDDSIIKYGMPNELNFYLEGIDLKYLEFGMDLPKLNIKQNGDYELFDYLKVYDEGEYDLQMFTDLSTSYLYDFVEEEINAKYFVNKMGLNISILEDVEVFYGDEDLLDFNNLLDLGKLEYEFDEDVSFSELEIKGYLGKIAGLNVGEYELSVGDMEESNPNFAVTFNAGSFKYIIRKSVLEIELENTIKPYGEVDPLPTVKIVEGLKYGDTLESIGFSYKVVREPGEIKTTYLYEDLLLLNDLENYIVEFVRAGSLRIENGYVKMDMDEDFSIKLPALSQLNINENLIDGELFSADDFYVRIFSISDNQWNAIPVEGTFKWKNDVDKKLDFKNASALYRTAVFSVEPSFLYSYNFRNTEMTIKIEPIKIEIQVKMTEQPDLIYNGSVYNIADVVELSVDNPELKMSCDKTIQDAGQYKIELSVIGHNYVLKKNSDLNKTITIKKAPLQVNILNGDYLESQEPVSQIEITGFINNENINSVTVEPVLTLPKKAGKYTLKTSGGEALNYYFEHNEKIIHVLVENKNISKDKDKVNAVIHGQFLAEDIVTLVQSEDPKRKSQSREQLSELAKEHSFLKDKAISTIYQVKIETVGDEDVQRHVQQVQIELPKSDISGKTLLVIVVSSDGKYNYVNANVEDGILSVAYEGSDLEYIILLEGKKTYLRYVGIGVGAFIALVLLITIIEVAHSKRKRKRYVKFD